MPPSWHQALIDQYPPELRDPIEQHARGEGMTLVEFLTRRAYLPNFTLPGQFTIQGVPPGSPGDPYTGARRSADFINVTQLECCIAFPHNRWHAAIGGAVSTTWTAVADPIFHWGVHWHVDPVFEQFREVLSQRLAGALSLPDDVAIPPKFGRREQRLRDDGLAPPFFDMYRKHYVTST